MTATTVLDQAIQEIEDAVARGGGVSSEAAGVLDSLVEVAKAAQRARAEASAKGQTGEWPCVGPLLDDLGSALVPLLSTKEEES